MLNGDVSPAEMHKTGFPGVEKTSIREDVPDILMAQIPLSEATAGMLGDARDPLLSHLTPPSLRPSPPFERTCLYGERYRELTFHPYVHYGPSHSGVKTRLLDADSLVQYPSD